MKQIISNTLRNFAVLSIATGIAIVFLIGGEPFYANGRLTDFTCYLIIGAVFGFTAWLWNLDRRVRLGYVDEATLPRWLQD